MSSEVITLLSFITYHRREVKEEMQRRQQENSLIYTTINSPSSRITLHWLKAFSAINFSVFSFSTLNKLIAVTFPHRHFFQPCAIIFWCLISSYTFCWSCDSETLQVAQYSDNCLWDGSWLCCQSLVRWQHHVPLWSHPGERRYLMKPLKCGQLLLQCGYRFPTIMSNHIH